MLGPLECVKVISVPVPIISPASPRFPAISKVLVGPVVPIPTLAFGLKIILPKLFSIWNLSLSDFTLLSVPFAIISTKSLSGERKIQ